MAKLHEVLAVLTPAKQQADSQRKALINTTFARKNHHFGEKIVTFQPIADGAPTVQEEVTKIQTTVHKELDWIGEIIARHIDAEYQVAVTNVTAKADVVLDDGTVILQDVPATEILNLQSRAHELFELVSAIPTLDPTKGFAQDNNREQGIYVSREEKRTRTQKQQKALVLYPATDKHPAQTQLVTEDVVIGTVTTQEWSSLITPVEKSEMLDRIEQLQRALKAAQARANDVPANTDKVAKGILSFVFDGK